MNANASGLSNLLIDLSRAPRPKLLGAFPTQKPGSKRLLKKSEKSEQARYPVLRVAPDGTVLYANRVGSELLERLGCRLGSRLPGPLCGLFPEVLSTGREEDIELRSDGEAFVFTVMPRPAMPVDGGTMSELSPSDHDGAGPDSAQVMKSLPIFFYMTGIMGNSGRDWVSPGIQAVTGFSPEEYLSTPGLWESRLHPEDLRRVMQAFRGAGADGAVSVEYRWRRADGRYAWFLDQAVLVRGQGGGARHMAGARIDITARRAAETWNEDSRNFLESMMDNISDGVFLADDGPRYVFMSNSYEHLVGMRREEWARGATYLAVHPDDLPKSTSAILETVNGKRSRCHARFRMASGAYIELGLSVSPFNWKGRQLALAIVTCLNRTL